MRTTLRRQRDGSLRPLWYGHVQIDGRERVFPLCRWLGTSPASGRGSDLGDQAFEESRKTAVEMLRKIVEEQRSDTDRKASLERIHAARYGEKIESVSLDDIFSRWKKFPRKRKPGKRQSDSVERIIQRFTAYVSERIPRVRTLDAITSEVVEDFLEKEEARGVTAKTYNVTAGTLKSVLTKIAPYSPAARFFSSHVMRESAPQHRQPFTAPELQQVFAAAQGDPLMKPLIICAATTAMRRGDVATLRWKDVDLNSWFVVVKTSKTGETAEIPVFPQLRAELEEAKRKKDSSGFVWPAAAAMYRKAPYLLDTRLRQILKAAGFVDPKKVKEQTGPELPIFDRAQTRRRAFIAIEDAGWTRRRKDTARQIVDAYLSGQGMKEMAVSSGNASLNLNAVEQLAGCAIIRKPATPVAVHGHTIAEADPDRPRLKRASLRGWHSFRTTWITLALANGLPMELVRRVTGHTTVDVVLRNYFRPGREAFRDALAATMPPALLGEAISEKKQGNMVSVAEVMRIVETAKTLREAKTALRALRSSVA